MIIHENYNYENVANDIAIVRLLTTIKNDPNIAIVQLPSTSDKTATLEGKLATIAGFGRTTDISAPSQHLRWVQALITGNEKCEKVFGKANVRDSNICLDASGGKSSCQGDSGKKPYLHNSASTFIASQLFLCRWSIDSRAKWKKGLHQRFCDPNSNLLFCFQIVVGIVSYGAAASCTSNYPVVFTRVTSYLDWIKAKTGIQIM